MQDAQALASAFITCRMGPFDAFGVGTDLASCCLLLTVLLGVPAWYLSRTRAATQSGLSRPSTSPTSEDVTRKRFAEFEAKAEAKRKDRAKRQNEALLAKEGGYCVGECCDAVSKVTFRGARRTGATAARGERRGVVYVRGFTLSGIWLSTYVDGGCGSSGDGATEKKCLTALLGTSIDLEYLQTEDTLEGAIQLLAQNAADGAHGALLGLYR